MPHDAKRIISNVASQMYRNEMLIDQLIMEYYFGGESNKDFEKNVLSTFRNQQRITILSMILKGENKKIAKTFERLNTIRNKIIHGGFLITAVEPKSIKIGKPSREVKIVEKMIDKSSKDKKIDKLYDEFLKVELDFTQAYRKYKGSIIVVETYE